MTDNALRVLKGFTHLSAEEKSDVISVIRRYHDSDYYGKQSMLNQIQSNSVGPKNSICGCCGS